MLVASGADDHTVPHTLSNATYLRQLKNPGSPSSGTWPASGGPGVTERHVYAARTQASDRDVTVGEGWTLCSST
jgi:hypothetical protein